MEMWVWFLVWASVCAGIDLIVGGPVDKTWLLGGLSFALSWFVYQRVGGNDARRD